MIAPEAQVNCTYPPTAEQLIPSEPAEHKALMASWLQALAEPEQVIELRALAVSEPGNPSPHVVAGYFDADHFGDLVAAALALTEGAKGVYFGFNPLKRDILARCPNKVDVPRQGRLAKDQDVERRRYLLIDADPMRPGTVSATDAEKAAALTTILAVRDYLTGQGWPEPILADSGNGYHLLYRIDLPADDGGLVKQVLHALAAHFDSGEVKIDTKVYNPSRICKLYGTLARKGDDTPERPHRLTAILHLPQERAPVPEDLLLSLAAKAPQAAAKRQPGPQSSSRRRSAPGRDREPVMRRAAAYLAKIPPAISGHSGHNQTFRAACILVCGFDLSAEEALPLLEEWNNDCEPPWTEKDLLHKLEGADKEDGERGYLLDQDRGNDDGCGGGDGNDAGSGAPVGGDGGDMPTEANDDPYRLARLFLKQRHTGPSGITLRHWRQEWHRWQGGAYRPYADDNLDVAVWNHVHAEFKEVARQRALLKKRGRPPQVQKVNRALCANVAAALRSRCLVEADVEQPAWLGDAPCPADAILAARNGLLHLPSYLEGGRVLHPPTPTFFTGVALDYDIDLAAPAPATWLEFLGRLWPGDEESIAALQEWFGYCLLPDTRQQKIFFLVGPPRSGKGTIIHVLQRLLGEVNVVNPALSDFSGPFGLQPLLGKQLAVITDARLSGHTDQGPIVEQLLAISGEDSRTVNRKNKPAVTTRLPTRFMIASNELPNLRDASGALVGRLVLLRLIESHLGKEDTTLRDRLLPELPGILLWAIEGLRQLRARGYFVQPASGRVALDQMSELSCPVKAFVEQCCELSDGLQVVKQELFGAWQGWCGERGHKAHNDALFGRNLLAAFPQVQTARDKPPRRAWVYRGVGLKSGGEWGAGPQVQQP